MAEMDALKTKEDITIVDNYLKERYPNIAPLFKFGLNVGLRIGDLLSLRYDSVDILSKRIVLIEQKTGNERAIRLNAGSLLALQELRAMFPNDVYLFQSHHKGAKEAKPLSRQYVARILKSASYCSSLSRPYRISTHTMRKTFGYHQYTHNGLSLAQLMDMFGHSSEKITLRYIGITEEDRAKAYESLVL